MSFEINSTFKAYMLPQDGSEAEQVFLSQLRNPHDTYLIAFGFTLAPMVDEIIANHAAGTNIYLYLDHSQSQGRLERLQVNRLVNAGVQVTIGTSTAGQEFICHTKGVVVLNPESPWCWEGSVNFSQSGWQQVNTAFEFSSAEWASRFVEQFKALRKFAWTRELKFQLLPHIPEGIDG